MKPDRTWERALRRKVRAALASASPELRRRARRVRKARDWGALAKELLVRFLLTGVMGWCVWLGGRTYSAAFAEAVFALWSLLALLMAPLVVQNLATNIDAAWLFLPLSKAQCRSIAMRRVARTCWRPVADGGLALSILLSLHGTAGPALWLVVPATLLYAAGMITGAFWLSRAAIPAWITTAPIWIMLLVGLTERSLHLARIFLDWLVKHAETVRWFGPGGWAGRLLAADFISLLPLVALAATLHLAWRSVRRNSDPERDLLWTYCNEIEADDVESFNDAITSVQVAEQAAREEEALRARGEQWHQRLRPADAGGWIERLVLQWASERDRLVMEFAMGATPPWTRQAWQAAAFLAAGVALQFAARWSGSWAGPVTILGLLAGVVALLRAGPFASGLGLPATPAAAGGIGGIHAFGLYPVIPADLLRLGRKIAIVRGIAFAPALAAAVWLGASAHDLPAGKSAWIALKAVVLLAAASPWAILIDASRASSTSQSRVALAAGTVLILLLMVLLMVFMIVATLLLPVPYDLCALAGGAIVAELTFFLHNWIFRIGAFDLIAQARR